MNVRDTTFLPDVQSSNDVRNVATPVLAHRLILVPELEGDPRARGGIVEEALAKVGYRRAVRPV